MATRSELIEKLHKKNPEILIEDMAHIVSECFDYISSELAKKNRVEIRGLGSFDVNEKRVVSSIANDSGAMRNVVHYKGSSVFEKM